MPGAAGRVLPELRHGTEPEPSCSVAVLIPEESRLQISWGDGHAMTAALRGLALCAAVLALAAGEEPELEILEPVDGTDVHPLEGDSAMMRFGVSFLAGPCMRPPLCLSFPEACASAASERAATTGDG